MKIGSNVENDTLQSLIRSSLLELNEVKFNLTELHHNCQKEDNSTKIKELESIIVDKEKEVSLIKFKADEAVDILKSEIEEKEREIQRLDSKVYELNYVNTSLEEVKGYFANQLKEYKEQELADLNERLNKSYKSIAEKDAYINSLSRQIDDYKMEIIKLENDAENQDRIATLEKELEIRDNQIHEINNKFNIIREKTVPMEEYYYLKEELNKRDNKIKRLEEINEFFNELQEESEYYNNSDDAPPFEIDKS